MIDTIILDKLNRIQEELAKQKAFEIHGEYGINNLKDRVEMLEKANDALSTVAYIKLLERIEKLESHGNYNRDYGLDLHLQLVGILEKIAIINPLVLAHENYLKKIDSIALHDLKKTHANMKLLNERMDQINKDTEEISKFECHNRALIDELQTDYKKRITELERFQDVTDLQYKQLKNNEGLLDIKPQVESLTLQHKNLFEWLERIDKIVSNIPDFQETNHEARISELQETIQRITKDDMKADRKPHVCPICNGRGGVEHPLTGLLAPAKCLTCNGNGIVWG